MICVDGARGIPRLEKLTDEQVDQLADQLSPDVPNFCSPHAHFSTEVDKMFRNYCSLDYMMRM